MASHPFDRYAAFTDLAALKEASSQPLRKCVRVNTLKCSVEAFKNWAEERGWKLTPVPWTAEGFFVERFVGQERSCPTKLAARGRDLRHLLGHFYMQEAASMLPVSLLDPQPGEVVLDLCAAPGSKTTQMAAALTPGSSPASKQGEAVQESGIVLANDMQEKRLRVLNDALQRTGAANVIIVEKVGQWFSRHMTERFDRVLCDAPCTAQGTLRKDPTALNYSSDDGIRKAAGLQFQLLEAAIHATKVGGRIVYSTCTLTPEENEAIIFSVLQRFGDCLEVLDPRKDGRMENGKWKMENAIEDSLKVQKYLQNENNYQLSIINFPFLRIWPQTYDTEGFFCAALRKVKRTKEPERMEIIKRTAQPLLRSRKAELARLFADLYGTDFLTEGDELIERGQQVLLTTHDASALPLPLAEYATGVPYAKNVGNGRYRITNEIVSLRGGMAEKQVMELSEGELSALLAGKDIPCSMALKGDTVLRFRGIAIGLGLAKEGLLLNRLPRWVVKNASVQPGIFAPERPRT